jgi:hypothetical protein
MAGVLAACQREEWMDAASAVMAEPVNMIFQFQAFAAIYNKGCVLKDIPTCTATPGGLSPGDCSNFPCLAPEVCVYEHCIPGIWGLIIGSWIMFLNTITFQIFMLWRCCSVGGKMYQQAVDKLKEKHPNADVEALFYHLGNGTRFYANTVPQFILSIFLIKDCSKCNGAGGNAKAMLVFTLLSGLYGCYQITVKLRHARAGTQPEKTEVGFGQFKFNILT